MKRLPIILLALTLSCAIGYAQQVQRCHTTEKFNLLKQLHPEVEQERQDVKDVIRQAKHNYLHNGANKSRARVTIPVVVHVMHDGEAIGTGTNISDAQVLSQIDVLNEDYQARNADTADVPAHFKPILGNPDIEFVMATIDPDGNLTDGIDRVDLNGSGWSDNLKPGTIWDADMYVNLWVTSIGGGTLGYATFPGTGGAGFDGVVIDYKYFGRAPQNPFNTPFDLGRTGTHEVGHYLGLDHTFNGGCSGTTANNCDNSGDDICDTPPTNNANYGCNNPTTRNTCTETPTDLPDMWMNYMDYSDDACLFMFTEEQAAVMNAVIDNFRPDLKDNVATLPQVFFSYTGQVVDATTGAGVPNAQVVFYNGSSPIELTTDASGFYTSSTFREGTYSVYAGKWGYMTTEFKLNEFITDGAATFTIPIESGIYYDDFIMDFGWTESGNASTGSWERDDPNATDYQGTTANPGIDIAGDFGGEAFVTGNAGGGAGDDDVDDGNTVLKSPTFDLSTYNEPYLSYYSWFFNDGGNGAAVDDNLTISISNGITTEVIEVIDANSPTSSWEFNNVKLSSLIALTANMQLSLETADQANSGHLVEAGIDAFKVVDSLPTVVGIASLDLDADVQVYPNPNGGNFTVNVSLKEAQATQLSIYTVTGAEVYSSNLGKITNEQLTIDLSEQPQGIYMLRLQTNNGVVTRRVSIF